MDKKKNNLWRLDVLEAHFLRKPVRYQRTRALLRVKGKNRSRLLPEESVALLEIEALKSDIFAKKLHSSLVRYSRATKSSIKSLAKKCSADEKTILEGLDVDIISHVRIVKLVSVIFKLGKKDHDVPFIPQWVKEALVDKTHIHNPSHFYNSMDANERNVYSKLVNGKEVQQIVEIIENSFKIILGPVDRLKRDIEDVESEDEDGSDGESGGISGDDDDDDDDEGQYLRYDRRLAVSDEESDVEVGTINYNEVTDEEESDVEDEFFVEDVKEKKKQEKKKLKEKRVKTKLPELAYGYVSGSEDGYDDDVVDSITQPKKNRRGQRARQKIWEQKYGGGAKHVQKEKDKAHAEREQKQREYEERAAKRAAKAEMSGSNNLPLGQKSGDGGGGGVDRPVEQAMHPSWIAKKKQDEALRNAKFSGKKIVF